MHNPCGVIVRVAADAATTAAEQILGALAGGMLLVRHPLRWRRHALLQDLHLHAPGPQRFLRA